MPRYSILLPTRNGASLLEGCLGSILSQPYQDFELVVSDNASDDATPQILARHAGDPRIVLLRQEESLGVTENWNRALAASTGERIGLIGDDDVLLPGYFERADALIQRHGDPDVLLRALATIIDRGHLARGVKPVHWCFDCGSALAEAEIEYQDKRSLAVDVAYQARQPQALASAFGIALPDAVQVAVPIWTTPPWTLPASLAVTLGAELEYVLVEGPARDGRAQWLVIAEPLAQRALQRYGVGEVIVHGRATGTELEGQRLQHPFYAEREIPLLLGEHVSAEEGTGAVHTAPGHGQGRERQQSCEQP